MSLVKAISILYAFCSATGGRRKYTAWALPIAAAIILGASPASAQTAFSFSFSGNGTSSGGNFSLTGSGTITPYGATTISVNGTSQDRDWLVLPVCLHSATEALGPPIRV